MLKNADVIRQTKNTKIINTRKKKTVVCVITFTGVASLQKRGNTAEMSC